MMVVLENARTGDRKRLGVGWNWSFLLFSSCLGIPLFLRGLTVWGSVMLTLWCLDIVAAYIMPDGSGVPELWPSVGIVGLSAFLACKGNALVARKWLARGYDFAKPDSAEARYAMESWGL
jgi:hypothetical protein